MAPFPVLFALFLAILPFVFKKWSSGKAFQWVMLLGSLSQLTVASFLVHLCVSQNQVLHTQFGNWPAPFGISFFIDHFSALMIWISSLLFFVVHLYSLASPEAKESFWAHLVCWNTLAAGVYGAFSTNDLFNLFVWFEVLLLSSYILLTWSQGKKNGLFSYIVLNVIGSSVFLFGLALLYSSTGTLNFADLTTLSAHQSTPLAAAAGFCLAFAFAMKAACFPLFNWLPVSYPHGPVASVALFAGLLTKVGIYALMRFFLPSTVISSTGIFSAMMISALATMLLGVYGAATHQSLRQILSFHIVSQVGYMALGFAVGTTTAVSATIFYLLHHMVVKTNLFLIAGAIVYLQDSEDLKNLGGLIRSHPWLAASFAISALSLAGIPPFSGFWAKFFILYAAAEAEAYWGLGIGLFVGLFTLFSMVKIWNEAFLKNSETLPVRKKIPRVYALAITILTLWTIALGLNPSLLTGISDASAQQILETSHYLPTLQGDSQ
jgi:multicomponent Na+:H+ antiporter subunit D